MTQMYKRCLFIRQTKAIGSLGAVANTPSPRSHSSTSASRWRRHVPRPYPSARPPRWTKTRLYTPSAQRLRHLATKSPPGHLLLTPLADTWRQGERAGAFAGAADPLCVTHPNSALSHWAPPPTLNCNTTALCSTSHLCRHRVVPRRCLRRRAKHWAAFIAAAALQHIS